MIEKLPGGNGSFAVRPSDQGARGPGEERPGNRTRQDNGGKDQVTNHRRVPKSNEKVIIRLNMVHVIRLIRMHIIRILMVHAITLIMVLPNMRSLRCLAGLGM